MTTPATLQSAIRNLKSKISQSLLTSAATILGVLLLCAGASLKAATNDLSRLVQQGLFEEEANHNLQAAEQAYKTVITEFDKDRKLAATAIFRLGEVYRKQGKTNEANAMYERIVREFSDQKVFADLSSKHLPRPTVTSSAPQQVQARLLVDNRDAHFQGNWTIAAAASDRHGEDYRVVETASKDVLPFIHAFASFHFIVQVAGHYHVEIWYPSGEGRSTNVSWNIYSAEEQARFVTVNQQVDGGKWLRLASDVYFTPGTPATVRVSNLTGETNALVVADAVRLVPGKGNNSRVPALHGSTAPEEAGAIIIDNTSAEFVGKWQRSSTPWPGTYGPDYQFAPVFKDRTNATALAYYRPEIKTAGRYDIDLWFPQGSNRSKYVPVRIRYKSSSEGVEYSEAINSINQQTNGGKWLRIASNFPFDAGRNGYVVIGNNTPDTTPGTVVIADAVRFVPTPENTSTKANRLEQEIKLVQQQLEEMQLRIGEGRATKNEAIGLQRELLALQNKLDEARVDDSPQEITVRPGDTVSAILQRFNKQGYNITLKQLLDANPQMDPVRLKVGDKIVFPSANESATGTSDVSSAATSEEAEEIRRIQALIKNSPDLINAINTPLSDRENPERGSPLHKAAMNGHVAVAKFLLDNGAEVELNSNKNQTPLGMATQNGHKAMVELLLSRGANVNAPSGGERTTALHIAAQNGFATLVQTLLAHKANPNAGDWNNRTPLHAARRDHSVIITSLLDAGADVNAKSKFGHTPLFGIQNPDLARLMIAKGANLNIAGDDGITVLWRAVESGNEALIKLFLEKGAKLDVTVGDRTLLHLAAEKGTASVVSLLARAGADPNAVSGSHPQTPLVTAIAARSVENLKALLAAGANLHATNAGGATPLHHAANYGFLDSVRELVAAGAKLNAQTLDGSTPLLVAVTVGKTDVVELLLAKGADPNLPTKDGRTPLAFAKEKASSRITYQNPSDAPVNWPKIVELLEKHGANENAQRRLKISVSRSGSKAPTALFYKGTNDLARYTLLEVFATVYQNDHFNLPTGGTSLLKEFFKFPDLLNFKIHRLTADGKEEEIKVNMDELLSSRDCSRDMWLEWGDIVEIPERDRLVNERWDGLPTEDVRRVIRCLERKVTVVVKGEPKVVVLAPTMQGAANNYNLFSKFEADINDALHQSRSLRASSDLTRVKLRRVDPMTGEKKEYQLDATSPASLNFLLRDGDEIEVPDRESAAPATSGTEPDLRSIPTRTLILPQAPTVGQPPPTPTVVPSLRTIPTKTLRMPPVSTPASPGGTNTGTAKP